jgi:hypothetical protein
VTAHDPAESPGFSLDDVLEHVESYGVDLLPPLDLSMETARAHAFFAELHGMWPHLFGSVTLGGAEFKISTVFHAQGGRQVGWDTFAINPRGPVFSFPRHLSVLRENVDLRGAEPAEVFEQAFDQFLRTFPGRQALRLGVVRQVVFGTGQTDCTPWLGTRVLQFDAGRLTSAQCALTYCDETYNLRIQMDALQVLTQTHVPVMGQMVTNPSQFGLGVLLDVNNRDIRPLSTEEMRGIVTRAYGLWPRGLLTFLNQRRLP